MILNYHHAFPSQERDEAVFVFARPYWIAFLPSILIFLFIFSLALAGQIYTFTTPGGITAMTANVIILSLGIFQLMGLIVFLISLLDFYFDLIIVTDRRLVDIDHEQLFYRKSSELNLRDVQDAKFYRRGFFQTFMNFGTIAIQTAGAQNNFTIPNIHHPAEVAALISDIADQAKSGVDAMNRFPELQTIGIIEGKIITNPEDLVVVGAMLPEDARRSKRKHAAQ
jgi:hypothetical protein